VKVQAPRQLIPLARWISSRLRLDSNARWALEAHEPRIKQVRTAELHEQSVLAISDRSRIEAQRTRETIMTKNELPDHPPPISGSSPDPRSKTEK
jgi:hypothetical protein